MERCNLRPWDLDRLSSQQMRDYLGCIAGESKAQRVKAATEQPPPGVPHP